MLSCQSCKYRSLKFRLSLAYWLKTAPLPHKTATCSFETLVLRCCNVCFSSFWGAKLLLAPASDMRVVSVFAPANRSISKESASRITSTIASKGSLHCLNVFLGNPPVNLHLLSQCYLLSMTACNSLQQYRFRHLPCLWLLYFNLDL